VTDTDKLTDIKKPQTGTSRRELFRFAAAGTLAAGLGACSKDSETIETINPAQADKITTRTIAEAEKLQGITYTPVERDMMLDGLEENLEALAALRAQKLPNTLAPALVFDPRVPGRSYGSQRNKIAPAPVEPGPLPSDPADIAFADIATQGAWLRAGALSARALTDIYLARIDQLAPGLECFVTVTAALARQQADKADQDFAEGRDRGPLHGIPYGLKDLADVAGVRTTWGATPYKDNISEDDAEVVRKLERAGAVLLGKTTCGALAYGDIWYGGKTRNPWNPAEGSSGSSAGSASATAAGLCSFSIGTETLGSIVSPSERCGTTGLRPTFGRVSRAGFMALCWSLDKIGPICRTVEDTALVLGAINGFDQDDPSGQRMGFAYDGALDVSAMTVGYVPAWLDAGDEIDRAAFEALKGLGVQLKEFTPPGLDFSSLGQIVVVEAAAAFADLTLEDIDDTLVWQEPRAWPNTFRQARFLSAVDYVQIDRLRRRLMQAMADAFDGFDAVFGPHYAGGMLLATNCTGHPQLALRAGYRQSPTRTGYGNAADGETGPTFRIPRGVSLWGDLFQEGKIIALGKALETALGVARDRPPLRG